MNFLKNKKVLLVGLGRLGGGVSTAKFLYKNGAKLTITDLNSEKELKKSVAQLKNINPHTNKRGSIISVGVKATFHLGGHKENDFRNSDIVVFNPAVSFFSPWVKLAKKYKKEFYNDYTLFLKLLSQKLSDKKFIGVTGTRGKTTVTTWIGHILSPSIIGGNIPQNGLLKIMDKITSKTPLVLELSSYQLEYIDKSFISPHIAVITNLSPDHLNRYGTMERYLDVKANIFKNQTKNDFLVLNYLDKYTPKFLSKKPKSQIYYFSIKPLPKNKNGLFFSGDNVYFQNQDKKEFVSKFKNLSPHQKNNLLASMLACHLYGLTWKEILPKTKNLPEVLFRQQTILKKGALIVVNDSASTSPEGVTAAIERFKNYKGNFILITGGTDKNLDFKRVSQHIKEYVKEKNLFLLNGTATKKLVSTLAKLKYFKKSPQFFDNLEAIVKGLPKLKKGAVVFSPGGSSFEKFKNEFDRGNKFNQFIRKYYGNN
ncbi:MAG: UDP-N-acetylmuramoyl-L-alanine--D-glutamate ligase [Candidatus Paceibacterota bacterium]